MAALAPVINDVPAMLLRSDASGELPVLGFRGRRDELLLMDSPVPLLMPHIPDHHLSSTDYCHHLMVDNAPHSHPDPSKNRTQAS
ncbi:hypothetical protein [uncultured Corynebacterium sp.]|uniref:hypothetical protein n=1 Tax=uncultured Corynebacterium sp. TaxID=159447 RepID=UPI0025D2A9A7|nr:hypothetical protein [uncultured Corynebacterium sp.]